MKNARKGRLTIRALRGGFTLIELMIVVAILGILAAVAFNLFEDIIRRSQEGTTKGNLGILRSSMAIYFGDNEQLYPTDDLTSLTVNGKYLALIPYVQTPTYHPGSRSVTTEISPTDTGNWSYDNVPSDSDFGVIFVGCTHLELHGNPWSSY